MDHTRQAENPSSSELTAAAVAERQAEAKEIAESLAGKPAAEAPTQSRYAAVTVSPGSARSGSSPVAEFVGFLEQTKRLWLMVVGTIVGLIVLVTAAQRGFAWFTGKRERKQGHAVAGGMLVHVLAPGRRTVQRTTEKA